MLTTTIILLTYHILVYFEFKFCFISQIFILLFLKSMMKHYAESSLPYLRNYGCVGRGYLNATSRTEGMPKDDVDAAFLWWKKCIHCAKAEYSNLTLQYAAGKYDALYDFDEELSLCGIIFIIMIYYYNYDYYNYYYY